MDTHIWIDKRMNRIHIKDMSDNHLISSMAIMRRRLDKKMLKEYGLKPEDVLPPIYRNMLNELNSRNHKPVTRSI